MDQNPTTVFKRLDFKWIKTLEPLFQSKETIASTVISWTALCLWQSDNFPWDYLKEFYNSTTAAHLLLQPQLRQIFISETRVEGQVVWAHFSAPFWLPCQTFQYIFLHNSRLLGLTLIIWALISKWKKVEDKRNWGCLCKVLKFQKSNLARHTSCVFYFRQSNERFIGNMKVQSKTAKRRKKQNGEQRKWNFYFG